MVLRLVKGGPERHAIATGQADAVLDPASGAAFLLPGAQRWLIEREAHWRKQAESQRPDRRASALDGLAAEVCALDAAGTILSTNQGWRDAAATGCLGAGIPEGANYLDACDNAGGDDLADGAALAAGIRQVIGGERTLFRYEHACDLAAGRRWFAFTIRPAAGDRAARAFASREDITGQKHVELLLELECAVARGLAEADGAEAALKAAIRALCESQGWDCGRYFHFDAASGVLRLRESWGVPTVRVGEFLRKSRGVMFRPGAGLEGRVYRSGMPLWVVAGARDDAVARLALAPATERDGTFIFPVTGEAGTMGVLAFTGRAVREPDDQLLRAARAIGRQLGGFLERQASVDALRRSEARFRRLTELAADWYWELDRNFRFTQYVGAGVLDAEAALGRTPWELPNLVPGSADWTEHRATLGAHWGFFDFEFAALRADGQSACYCISGEPVFDDRDAFIGYRGIGVDISRRTRAGLPPQCASNQLRNTCP